MEDVGEEDDEGSPEIRPPRMSLALEGDDDDNTHTSVEYPRRATFNRDRDRLSMMSLGAPRLSENFADATGLEDGSDPGDNTGITQDGEDQDETIMSQGALDGG